MPVIRPFRALRYEPDAVGDLALVVSPPYDVIGAAEHGRLLARHPRNVVRLDLPTDEPGDAPDDRYRRAARAFAAWRSDGTFHKDPRPSLYVYEQTYRVPGAEGERVQRGFFARVRLEPFGEGSGIRRHERTMDAPKEDRYRLLRATGVNTSPVVGLYEGGATSVDVLDAVTSTPPTIDLTDDDGTRHRLWVVPDDGDPDGRVARLVRAATDRPITIADGHHRYETALRYRDERRMSRACEEDPAFDYILMLLVDAASEPLTILPTHRVLRLDDQAIAALWSRLPTLFDIVGEAKAAQLVSAFDGAGHGQGGRGWFGLWTRGRGAVVEARRAAFEPLLPSGGSAVRRLDVVLLGVALEQLAGIDADAVASGAVAYTKSAAEAVEWVTNGTAGAGAAFLLEPTPVRSVLDVAAEGDVMPQKSTYFHPKALTGLVLNPHEW